MNEKETLDNLENISDGISKDGFVVLFVNYLHLNRSGGLYLTVQ